MGLRARRGGGGIGAGFVSVLLVLLLALCGRGATGLDDDGELLMLFKRAVTADPLGALAGWSVSDADACAWNGVICNGFPPTTQTSFMSTANLTSTTDGATTSNSTTTLTTTSKNGTTNGTSASAATVSRVIGLVLPNAQLSGTLPADLSRIQHLRHLDLSGNNITSTLPPALLHNATELRVLSLAGNDLTGSLPDGAPSRGLQELNLSDNALAGWLPAPLLAAPGLAVLGLANNYLAGELPAGGLGPSLQLLDLSSNYFRGALPPDFGGARLRLLNVSSNRLTGALPAELSDAVPPNATVDLSGNNFTGAVPPAGLFGAQPAAAYEGNPGLCGAPVRRACSIPSSLSDPPNATDSPPAFAAIPKSAARAPPGSPEARAPRGGQGRLRPLTILAIVAGDIAGVGLLFLLFLYVYHARKKRRQENPTAPQQQQKTAAAVAKEGKPSASAGCCIGGGRSDGSEDSSDCSASSSSDAASDDGRLSSSDPKKRAGSFIGWSTPQHHSKKHEPQQAPAPATLVTVDVGGGELEMETLLKASAYILGATGSSIVYKAVLADGTALAVRRIGESGGADKLKDFEAQVRAVARFRHPNLLRLRGFYWGADEKLLIHDYAVNGSLANIAFTRRMGASPMHLNLEARLRIARGVARGLSFIHEKKGVHGNVKPSNILLGADMEPLVGDLGLDRLLSGAALHRNTGASARLFGSKRSMHSTSSLPDLSQMPGGASPSCASTSSTAHPPYQAPECLKSLRPSAKWDVYSFGMVLLELLSGRVYSEVELCQWHAAGSVAGTSDLDQRGRVLRMADPTLRGDDNEDALLGCFRLAFACCAMAPGKRPSMRDVAALLDRIQAAPLSNSIETPY
ncbi:probable LRR receptor-like serine/threonine-protein kinase At4g37250 [Lolium perenne]|uniref:probable LRR receptor-like serine/threonine-protein kinase At4g37250 n=1 Tax=Lolium perenne TaxID=4522 RepID=UPI0021EA4780|nr:probable LRR receptor-like serine/threonine-protein kinase At4g37250 [Lolium perenne]